MFIATLSTDDTAGPSTVVKRSLQPLHFLRGTIPAPQADQQWAATRAGWELTSTFRVPTSKSQIHQSTPHMSCVISLKNRLERDLSWGWLFRAWFWGAEGKKSVSGCEFWEGFTSKPGQGFSQSQHLDDWCCSSLWLGPKVLEPCWWLLVFPSSWYPHLYPLPPSSCRRTLHWLSVLSSVWMVHEMPTKC